MDTSRSSRRPECGGFGLHRLLDSSAAGFFGELDPARVDGVVFGLGLFQFGESGGQGVGVGDDFGGFNALLGGEEAGVGGFDAGVDGVVFALLEIRKLLAGRRGVGCGCGGERFFLGATRGGGCRRGHGCVCGRLW